MFDFAEKVLGLQETFRPISLNIKKFCCR